MLSAAQGPCAACKCRRQKCTEECIFAPYFPPNEPQKFEHVHKIYGASNVAKILRDLPPDKRAEAVNSLSYEAQYRIHDPIYGCIGFIAFLQKRLGLTETNLELRKNELAFYYTRCEQQKQQHVQQQQQWQQNDDGGANDSIPDFNQDCSLFQSNTQYCPNEGGESEPSLHGAHRQMWVPYGSLLSKQVQPGENKLKSHSSLSHYYYPQQRLKNEVRENGGTSHGSLASEQVEQNLQYYPQQMEEENGLRQHSSLLREQDQLNQQYHPQRMGDENELGSSFLRE